MRSVKSPLASRPKTLTGAIGVALILAVAALPAGAQAEIHLHVQGTSHVTLHSVEPGSSGSTQAASPAPSAEAPGPSVSPAPAPPAPDADSQDSPPSSDPQSDTGSDPNGDTSLPTTRDQTDQLGGNPFLDFLDPAKERQIELAVDFANAISGLSSRTPPAMPTADAGGPGSSEVLCLALSWLGLNYEVEDGPGNTGCF